MDTTGTYQELCEELDMTPYAVMDEQRMMQSIDEMMRIARQTPGSRHYLT